MALFYLRGLRLTSSQYLSKISSFIQVHFVVMLRFVDPCLGIYLFSMTSSSFMQYVEFCDESINETRVLCCHLSQPSANFSLQPLQIFPRRIFPPRSEKAYPVMGFTKPSADSRARWRPAGN